MTPEEFKEELASIEQQARLSEQDLRRRYALSNKKFKVGDIITGQGKTILIEQCKISLYHGFGLPVMYYYGIETSKSGVPLKKKKEYSILESLAVLVKEK